MRAVSFVLGTLVVLMGCTFHPPRTNAEDIKLISKVTPAGEIDGEGRVAYHFWSTFEVDGRAVSQPRVTMLDGQWATIMVTSRWLDDAHERLWEETDDGPRLAGDARVIQGSALAVRCEGTPAGKVSTWIRAYYFDSGELVGTVDARELLTPGEETTHRFED